MEEKKVEQKFHEFEVKVLERENKETKEKFNVYQALTKKGNWIDLKFTQNVAEEDRPLNNCLIVVADDHISVDRKRKYPVCWVSKIEQIKEFDTKQDVSDYFN